MLFHYLNLYVRLATTIKRTADHDPRYNHSKFQSNRCQETVKVTQISFLRSSGNLPNDPSFSINLQSYVTSLYFFSHDFTKILFILALLYTNTSLVQDFKTKK